jgi:hypothetical protein
MRPGGETNSCRDWSEAGLLQQRRGVACLDQFGDPGAVCLDLSVKVADALGQPDRFRTLVKEQLRILLAIGSLADAAAAKERLQALVERAAQPETNRLWRTVCRWWKEIEVLIVTGATTAKVEANNTAIKHIKRTARGFTNARN